MTDMPKTNRLGSDRYSSFQSFGPESMDPRIASSERVRDRMIALRRDAGLPDFPPQPLYPDQPVRFAPERKHESFVAE